MTDELMYYPARVVRAQNPIASLFPSEAELLARYNERFPDSDITPYFLKTEISNNSLDYYFTHMLTDSLQNYAADADQGVGFQDSHNTWRLGYGRSLFGRYHSQPGTPPGWDRLPRRGREASLAVDAPQIYERVLSAAHIAPGLKLNNTSYASTDDFIRATQAGAVEEVSIGIISGQWFCDICGANYFSWDCSHIAGFTYDIEREDGNTTLLATVGIKNAHIGEYSAVYAGATPNAVVIRKATQEAEAGRLSPKMAHYIEDRFRIKLPEPAQSWRGIDFEERSKPMPNEKTAEERVTELETELATANAEIERLKPLAEQGERYRADLINETLAEGVRANGQEFPTDAYREILQGTSLDNILAMRDQYAAQARKRLAGGRQTVDADETEATAAAGEQPKQQRNGLPDAAYAA